MAIRNIPAQVRRIGSAAARHLKGEYGSLGLLRERRIGILAVANMLDMMSATIFVPLLPSLAEELGASAVVIGLIFTVPAIVSAVVTTPAGYISDRIGHRPLIANGMTLSALPVIAIAFAWSPLVLILLRSLDALIRAFVGPATTAYLGDAYDKNQRGEAFGAYHTSSMIGAAAGPAVGGTIAAYGNVRLPFIVLGSGTLVGGMVLLLFLPTIESEPNTETETESEGLRAGVSWNRTAALFTGSAVVWLVIASVDNFGSAALNPTFPLLLSETIGRGPGYVGTTYSALALAMLIFLPIGGRLSDRVGRIRVLAISYAGWCIVMVGLALTKTPLIPPVLMFLGGILSALSAPASFALMYEIAPDGREATFSGLTSATESIGKAAGPLFAGIIMGTYGVQMAVIAAGLSWLLAIPLMVLLPPTERR